MTPTPTDAAPSRLPLRGWALELARRWNSATYSLYVLHGNIYDVFPVLEGAETRFVSLKQFLARRIFPTRAFLLYYDIGDGLTFGAPEMQQRFFEWLAVFDQVENTNFARTGPPREFTKLAPLLRRFFLHAAQDRGESITLHIDFPEKIIPASSDASTSLEERMALVTLLKWAASAEMRKLDLGVIVVTETAAKLAGDLLQNPHVAQIELLLPEAEDRLLFLQKGPVTAGRVLAEWSDFSEEALAGHLSGLNLARIQHLLAEALGNGARVTAEHVARGKKRLIEEYCQGLVRFKSPKPGLSLDAVATHHAAKARLRELAWLIANGKRDVLERGVLLPGRVGVGKSFLVDAFAGECGLPVMELAEFRSKWVGDTELQQARILMTIRALGPVIVVVDEADAVFGTREGGGDSGVSGRVFAAFAAHLGDSSLRGRELWIAMTSRPDLLAIDMKRQGRFGLAIPLFAAANPDEVAEQFATIARYKKIALSEPMQAYIREHLGTRPLTGSDVDAILTRAKERAVLAKRDNALEVADLEEVINSFIDPLDPHLLELQELAAVLACSDRRYLPAAYRDADRAALADRFALLKRQRAFA
ncbi:MAG TPA: AAA family ATPase [Chthoniobacteraceae bacterium]|jgi:AAA+ superfamily predicted ATPase|nr:AAA family ATPase [Chthoniobacteraceae bacterium]